MGKKTGDVLPSFAQIASSTGHISSKTVNTNVLSGVRYAAEDAVRLPYVSVRSMLAVPGTPMELLDYQGNAALSRYAKKLLGIVDAGPQSLKEKSGNKPTGAQADLINEKSQIPDCTREDKEGLRHRALIGDQEEVNARLRQVLLPLPDGRYVSVTPLESSGLGALLHSRIKPYLDPENKIPGWRRPKLASMPIGGTKPQNVGIRVRDMVCLFVKTPNANSEIRSAVRAAFNGVRLLPSVKLLYQWRDSGQVASLCSGLGNRTEKDLFSESVQPLAQNILENARNASLQVKALLERQSEETRDEAWAEIGAQVGFVQLGFITPALRSPKWAERAAWAVTNALSDWLLKQAKQTAPGPTELLVLTASAKTVLVATLAREFR
jgi:hypothetical protein